MRVLRNAVIVVLAFLIFFPALCNAATLRVSWNANTETDLGGYLIYYGTESGNYIACYDVGKITSYGITGVQSGATIYIAMAAYDTSQNDSALSTEQHVTVPNVTTTVTVPNVAGKTQAAASSALTSAGLKVGTITTAYSSTVASGNVISQSPVSGTSVASGSAVNLTVSKGPQPVLRTVPNVVGKTQAAASSALTSALLTTGAITQAYSSTFVSGNVISQSPVSGTSVASGSAVNLTVSKGPQPVLRTVPNVVGKTQAAASSALTSALLTTGAITQAYSSTVVSGNVISQSPVSGTSVASGSAVNLTVSKGPQPVLRTVPNVVGKTQAAASSALTSALLTTGTITQAYSSTVVSGNVISQSPVSGTSVASGTAVNLTVSVGVKRTVPNVVGKTQAAASSALTSAGLKVGTITTAYSSTVASGNVISQSPVSGTSVTSGTAVNLTVSKGVKRTVPNVVGKTQAAASSALTSAGLKVGTITTAYSSTVASGNVISQSPVSGTSVTSGTAVNLTVSSSPGT